MVKYLPTNAGLISSQGRFHMPRVDLSPSTTTVGPVIYKGSHSNEKPEYLHVESSPCSPQVEKACMQQPNSTLAKNKNKKPTKWTFQVNCFCLPTPDTCTYLCPHQEHRSVPRWLLLGIPARFCCHGLSCSNPHQEPVETNGFILLLPDTSRCTLPCGCGCH